MALTFGKTSSFIRCKVIRAMSYSEIVTDIYFSTHLSNILASSHELILFNSEHSRASPLNGSANNFKYIFHLRFHRLT